MEAPRVTGTRLGIVLGSALGAAAITSAEPERRAVTTDHGTVTLLDTGDHLVLCRHGIDTFTPAHRIDHRANVAALAAAGCDRVLAIASTGALRRLPVGTFVAPHDLLAFGAYDSFFDDARGHLVPGFHPVWRAEVIAAWRADATLPLTDGGVYAQTRGPRFETPAEVGLLAQHADLVGMTLANECFLAREAGIAYAGICSVDNVANGAEGQHLTLDEFHTGVELNRARLAAAVQAVAPRLAATPRPAP